ncbi:putative ubiquitin-conjugating enzyme E2 38 [Primulina eburnea]|uniref:putative ubiquitin-conjugating enzyme E2 38 n=1 Tax=Primulina eburnea TaxID=1245227 RepID=UPI003C6BE4F0
MEFDSEILDSEDSVPEESKHGEVFMEKNVANSTSIDASVSVSPNSEDFNESDMLNQEDENEGDLDDEDEAFVDDCDLSEYGSEENYFYEDNDDDDYSSMQAQFDNVDIPPGVEASVTWLNDTKLSSNAPVPLDFSTRCGPASSASVAASVPVPSNGKCEANVSSNSSLFTESSSSGKEKEVNGVDLLRKSEAFKQFDVVGDYSDHHYGNLRIQGQEPSKAWTKKIQEEWKILEKDLPDTIFVRVYESRMDLLRAVIIGPQGTPYHDGLFVFDILFPPTYPDVPPMVYYYSGGLRLNPNLYDCGKVCLSLLNTWTGRDNEKWLPKSSTMLQVLVSIQALILNAKPFFNEPGYDTRYVGQEGERKSNSYNEDVFILSLKTMMYTLRRPPKHFEDLVSGHFHSHAHAILSACRAYMDGALVGSLVNESVPDGTATQNMGSPDFKEAVGRMLNGLVSNFTRYGSPDCEQFRLQQ